MLVATTEVDMNLARWQKELEQSLVQLQSVHSSDHAFDLAESTKLWLDRFNEDNAELGNHEGLSVTDLVFAARCHLQCVAMKRRYVHPPNLIHQLLFQIIDYSCRHRPSEAPQNEAIDQLEQQVARLLVQTMHTSGPQGLTRLAMDTKQDIEPQLKERIEMLQNVDDEKTKENEVGALFDLTDAGNRIFALAGRFFACVSTERALLARYEISTIWIPNFNERERLNVRTWLTGQARYESSDVKIRRTKELFYDSQLPVGARLAKFRKLRTKDQQYSAFQLLEQELGSELASSIPRLVKPAMLDLHVIASDPNHRHFEIALYSEFEYAMNQTARFSMAPYFVLNSTLMLPAAEILHRRRTGLRPRLPVLTQLQGRLMIHHSGQWIAVRDMTDALLMWCFLIRTEFSNKLGDGNTLLPDWCSDWLELDDSSSGTAHASYEPTEVWLRRCQAQDKEEDD